MTREIDFRYTVIRNGADYWTLQVPAGSPPSVRMSDTGEIKSSFSADFLPPTKDVDWFSDELRPDVIINGVTHHLGVFLPASVTEQETDTGKILHVEAYDRSWRIRDNYTESLLHLDAGLNYVAVVQQLLTACGVGLISATPTTATLAEAREDWPAGTSYLSIVNQLLAEINYNELWFDSDGIAVLEPASVPTAANIEHVLDDTNVDCLMLPAVSKQTDIYSAPNVFICICSNADKSGPMIATSENTNPQSPLSINRRGRRIARVIQVNNIASHDELQAYADRLRSQSMITGETISVQTGILPGFGLDDVTGIRFGDLFAVCIERSWTMQLQVGGVMSHTLEKVVVNIG